MSAGFWIGLLVGNASGLFLGGLLCAASRAEEVGRGDLPDVRAVDGASAPPPVPGAPAAPDQVLPDSDLAL
mgnify:CR=1 FL=1